VLYATCLTLRRLVRRQIDAGINFLVPCGTTGESPTLSRAEHLRVVEIALEEAKGRVPVLAGAGGYNTHEVIELARAVSELPQLDSAARVMEPLRDSVEQAVTAVPAETSVTDGAAEPPVTVALAINRALHDVLRHHPEALVFGEDVARKGGVYGVTRGLLKAGGPARVFDGEERATQAILA